jgi:endonuclease/exonuclease/phosphatase (EEP) superfamily protein YafD
LSIRPVALLFAAVVALPCVVVAVARLAGGGARSPLPQLAAFTPWTLFGWLLVLVLLLATRSWWPGVGVLVPLAVVLGWTWLPAAPPPSSVGGSALRVMTVNVLIGRAEVEAILDVVQADGVDLLAVQEATSQFSTQLDEGLRESLPHLVTSNPEGGGGSRIWSRLPIKAVGTPFGQGGQIFQVSLVHPAPLTAPLTVTVVHTMSPGRHRVGGWNRDLEDLVRAARTTTGPHLMLGDFNATRDHGPFRRLLRVGLVDAADSPWGLAATWPADRRHPALVRLDHVLVTPDTIGVRAVRSVVIPGTDHRAVRADVAIAPS